MITSILLTLGLKGASKQVPYYIVRDRVPSNQRELFDQVPLDVLFEKVGFASSDSAPSLFERLEKGEGSVRVRRSGLGSRSDRLISVSMSDNGNATSLTVSIDSTTGRLRSWHFVPDAEDQWRRTGWIASQAYMRFVAETLVKHCFPASADIQFRSAVQTGNSGEDNDTRRHLLLTYQWILDGRSVGGAQSATVELDEQSGVLITYLGTVGEVQRRVLLPNELGQSRAHLTQRLATRFGSGHYMLGQSNLIYTATEENPWLLVPKWELLCTELNHLGRRSAIIQIVMDPDTKAVLHENRSGGGFGPSSPVPGNQIAGEWEANEANGLIKATDRKASQGGVQRSLTRGNRLLVGTFYAAERLLEVKGVFFEVDPALSEALAKAQPPASLNYGQ